MMAGSIGRLVFGPNFMDLNSFLEMLSKNLQPSILEVDVKSVEIEGVTTESYGFRPALDPSDGISIEPDAEW
jgi:hypothetical protein